GGANAKLFDRFVGATKQRYWEGKSESFGRLEVDDQLGGRGLLHRQVSGFLPLENAAGIIASEAIGVGNVSSVAHQPASHYSLAPRVDSGHRIACRQPDELITTAEEERIGTNHKPACL